MVIHYGKLCGKRHGNPGVIYRADYMVKGNHKPPSRVRYEESHPTMSCRLNKDTRDLLKQRLEDLGGLSFADFVKDSLGLLQLKMPDIEEIKETAWAEGYDQAKKTHRIWYFCAVCQKRIDVVPNSDSHKAIIGYMKEHGWGHASCHEH
ncbi:unnamed protein product [marine sediment metagenome]|uniref:Uncharacterized protein n=1 Tax=marine sediment metagenome TaxID=412755 RepID=X1V9Z6_9ZZZZ